MSNIVVVYDELREALYAAVDKAIAEQPGAAPDRENLYQWALSYFDEHAVVPEFRLEPKPVEAERGREAEC